MFSSVWFPVVACLAFGLLPASIARKKGRNEVTWWFYGAVLPFVALPHALALETKYEHLFEGILFGCGGIGAGLVLGFIVGNWAMPSGGNAAPMAGANAERQASVNSSNSGQALPPGHPPIDSGQTIPAPPLPGGTPGASESTAASAPGATTAPAELPSLDPLQAGSKEERAEQKYKNIQLLKGIPSERLMKVMFAFKASLGVDCTYCHIKDQFEKDDKPTKQTARKMIQLVRDTNAKLGTTTRVTCFTCHRGSTRPAS